MHPFINIHTHHLSHDKSICLMNNRFGFDKEVYSESYFSIGIHPWDSSQNYVSLLSDLEKIAKHQNCLAIGECGLDKIIDLNIDLQKTVFEAQLQLAIKLNKPVIIHCVKAFDELIELCKPYQTKIPLVIHGFNKTSQLATQLIKQGFYLSLNPSIFYKPSFDFSVVSPQKLFLETDANELILIEDVYKMASECFKMSIDDLKEKIYSNFTTIFYKHGR